jgi:hypothetical protein
MGVDREYRIRITTAADVAGAEKTKEALNATTGATARSAEAMGEASKATEKHGAHLHALHGLFHALNEIVPGFGIALQAAFSPIGAAISLAVMALRLFHDKMKEVNEEFKRMEEEAAKPLTHRLEAQREATIQAAVEMAALRDRLEQAARGEQSLKQQMESAISVMKLQAQIAESVGEAMKENELARLENMHKAGLVSEDQYAGKRIEIEQAYLQKKRELEEQAEQAEIMMRRRTVEQAEMAQPELKTAAEAALAKQVKAEEDLGVITSGKGEVEERHKKAAAALKAWEDAHPDSAGAYSQFHVAGQPISASDEQARAALGETGKFSPFEIQNSDQNFETWSKLQAAADATEKEWKSLPKQEAYAKVAAASAAREAARAAKKAEDNQDAVTSGRDEIASRQSRLDIRRGGDAELSALGRQRVANAALGTPNGRLLMEAAAAESTLQHGGQVGTKQAGEIAAAQAELHRAYGAQAEAVLKALGQNANNVDTLAKQIAAIYQRLEAQGHQIRNGYNF